MTEPTIIHGDCLTVMATMDAGSVDAVVCDPPYDLTNRVVDFLKCRDCGARGTGGDDACRKCGGELYRQRSSGGGFMGKDWDSTGIAFAPETWAEALRVLKPGGHLLAFGGTRTFHRMAVAIEDAGFEIRDTLSWLYGSGFPKSLDVGKAIDKAAGAERDVIGENAYASRRPRKEYQHQQQWGSTLGGADSALITAPATDLARQWDGWGTALKPATETIIMARKPAQYSDYSGTMVPTLEELSCQLRSLAKVAANHSASSQNESNAASASARWNAAGACSTPDALCDLMATWPFESVMASSLSTVWSWLNIWADLWNRRSTFTTETASSLITDLRTLNSLLSAITPESIIQAVTQASGAVSSADIVGAIFNGVQAKLLVIRTASVAEPVTSTDDAPALRPDIEFIFLARKPLAGTVAQNVAAYGTGAINVDGCRIGGGSQRKINTNPGIIGGNFASGIYESGSYESRETTAGRWPANLLFDEDAAALLDAMSGERPTGGQGHNGPSKGQSYAGGFKDRVPGNYSDSGGASRFFFVAPSDDVRFAYVPKASRAERNAGLEGLPEKANRINAPRLSEDHKHSTLKANHHPTVKPLALMRWLVRLVTPPNGLVLDPFAGSGTTGCAAALEGFRFVGIEQDAEYVEIARQRIAHWSERAEQPPPQLALPLEQTA